MSRQASTYVPTLTRTGVVATLAATSTNAEERELRRRLDYDREYVLRAASTRSWSARRRTPRRREPVACQYEAAYGHPEGPSTVISYTFILSLSLDISTALNFVCLFDEVI
jgi:hypothetical protein